ncbi:enoyl-CoA hydratase/isomerase family protein [Streptomyces sp. NA04227]|uniref:enoyl-CoA hydratase/isomerase family protein n=1 Tax=Streptomyces sp. NA04227 TaxID=2742136 RepID=UPI001592456A|nr:enoyl-CoA hydratase/isomerase family protein [Streptomyces sp. NA04227]QKW08898.1 enoyl-CoA hydratase/isomerase family protein [Streptomyces sp. NA04227]
MTRPQLPAIGRDPTPGDVLETRNLARRINGLATDLGTTVRELEQVSCGAWKGKTAVAFAGHVGEDLTPLFKKSHESFSKAASALSRWATQLQEFQDETDRLEKAAQKALDERDDAKTREDAKSAEGGKGDGKGEGADKGKSLADAEIAVGEAMSWLHDLDDRYAKAAKKIGEDLEKAGNIAPNKPGLFDRIADGFKGMAEWVKDHADIIALVGDLLSDLTAILGLLAIITLPFPPLAAIFGTAALITGGLALGAHSLAKLAGADVSWAKIGLDAVGLLPGIGLFGKGAKLAKGADDLVGTAAKFGKGFTAAKVTSAKNILAMGEMAGKVKGGVNLFQKVAIGGTAKKFVLVSHESSGTMSRLAGLAQGGYHEGQWLGTKGLKLITGGKADLDPFSAGGRALDGALKIAPKLQSIPQHVGEAINPGDRFAAAH